MDESLKQTQKFYINFTENKSLVTLVSNWISPRRFFFISPKKDTFEIEVFNRSNRHY